MKLCSYGIINSFYDVLDCNLYFLYNIDGNIASTKGTELYQQQKQKHDLQKEVLSTLFNYHGHSEEPPERIVKDLNKKSRYEHVVFEPPKDFPEEIEFGMDFSRPENIDGTSCYSGKMDSYFFLSS